MKKKNNKKNNKVKKRNIVLIIKYIISFSLSMYTTYTINAYEYKVELNLKGEKDVTIIYPEKYIEKGVTAKSCSLTHCRNINKEVKIEGEVDSEKLGTYKIKYNLTHKNKKNTLTRTITVKETEPPKIELKGEKNTNICPNTKYIEDGYIAIDNYDGDITDKVKIIEENNTITYEISDSSNNIAKETRTINYLDNSKPTINLNGNYNITLSLGQAYQEPGFTATDNCDGNITNKVIVSGNINTNTIGTQKIIYTVTDSSGNKTSVTRNINIYNFNTNDINSYISSLETYIKNNNYKVHLGYYNLQTGYTYAYKENHVLYGASLVKTVDALYAYEKLELNDNIKTLVSKAISVSDNPSHKELVNIIGKNNLRIYGQSLGAKNFLVEPTDTYGNTSVNDQLAIWKYLYNFINTNPNGNELKSYFINTFANKLMYPGCPTIMHKYGLHKQYYHDVGIVFDDSPYIIVILTEEGNNNYWDIVSDLSKKMNKFNELVS